jgi:hypothetical protein
VETRVFELSSGDSLDRKRLLDHCQFKSDDIAALHCLSGRAKGIVEEVDDLIELWRILWAPCNRLSARKSREIMNNYGQDRIELKTFYIPYQET